MQENRKLLFNIPCAGSEGRPKAPLWRRPNKLCASDSDENSTEGTRSGKWRPALPVSVGLLPQRLYPSLVCAAGPWNDRKP